jgi:hypothetical protein
VCVVCAVMKTEEIESVCVVMHAVESVCAVCVYRWVFKCKVLCFHDKSV